MSALFSRALRDELVAWARQGLPDEACGIIAGTARAAEGGQAVRFHGLTNAAHSPYRYLVDAGEQLRTLDALDEAGEVVWGIFHSHVRSPAVPSPTDVGTAQWPDGSPTYPGALYLLCSLADPEGPEVRAWTIVGGEVSEVALEIDGA
ncbi:MAG TPA: M67 family metallopeptidase [Candidatus Limnocylindrales bacterium]|nr:M67 family metallopeptidase [Candidatus Limnocylindrales bacterium]